MKKKAKKGSAKGRRKGSAAKDLTAKKASSVKGGVINVGVTTIWKTKV